MDATLYERDLTVYGSAWNAQAQVYRDAWYYYDGKVFDQRAKGPDNKPGAKKYPLKINQARYSANKHALHLWGQADHANIIQVTVKAKRDKESPKERASYLQTSFYDFLEANEVETLMREAGRVYMVTGDAYFKLRPDPTNDCGVTLEFLAPDNVFPVWNPANYNQLLRCHIKYQIPNDIAELYGYKGLGGSFDSNLVDWLEIITLDEWAVFLGHPGSWTPAIDPQTGETYAGENRCYDPVRNRRHFPIVHIPRLRTGKFYGQSLIADIDALQDELNARLADQGDAVAVATHPGGWGRNLKVKGRAPLRVSGPEIIDVGDTVPGGSDPYIEQFQAPDITQGVTTFTDKLESILYDLASISPVMRGVDEGSQRSGLTLSVRALPTTSLVDDYRAFFRKGVKEILHVYMGICWGYRGRIEAGLNEIEKQHFGHRFKIEFAPILPRDRTEIADQVTKFRAAKAMSRKRAVELQPDIDDADAELKAIEAEAEQEVEGQIQLREAQAKIQAANRLTNRPQESSNA